MKAGYKVDTHLLDYSFLCWRAQEYLKMEEISKRRILT